jgi:hypothetical protein
VRRVLARKGAAPMTAKSWIGAELFMVLVLKIDAWKRDARKC